MIRLLGTLSIQRSGWPKATCFPLWPPLSCRQQPVDKVCIRPHESPPIANNCGPWGQYKETGVDSRMLQPWIGKGILVSSGIETWFSWSFPQFSIMVVLFRTVCCIFSNHSLKSRWSIQFHLDLDHLDLKEESELQFSNRVDPSIHPCNYPKQSYRKCS